MEEADDSAGEDTARPKSSSYDKEIIWSVGDRCQTKWSGDDKPYTGIVKKLRHSQNGRVVALVKFIDYDSDDCEEVDVEQLQRVLKVSGGRREEKGRSRDRPGGDTGGSGLFSPLTGSEDISRLEDKYGHESDSDCEERSDSSKWISPTPYETKGKVSAWKMKSPVKSAACFSQHHKSPVVQVRSPRKKAGHAGSKADVPTQRENDRRISSNDSAYATSVDGSSLWRSSSGDGEIRTAPEQTSGRHETDDSVFCLTSEEGLFEGFDEDDMEKPKFSFSAPSDKVPFCLDDSQNVQIPAALNQYLRDYQREGVQFLYGHYRHNRGAVLGDDMGLGKTVQVIGFLSALMGKQGNRRDVIQQKPRFIRLMSDTPDLPDKVASGPVLIIGPGSVLYNWLEELDTWGHFTVRKYHGADKASCLVDVARGKVEIVVTTFETCRDNIDALNKVNWDAVIVDEVHRIKGLKAQTTIALRTLKCVRRYGLTGTALQNNMSELWCILDWAQPSVLGGAEDFEEDFVRPIELGQKQNATKRELAVARKKKEEFAAVRKQMMLRRTKKLIADQLPVKTDRVVFCRLVPLQISVYRAVLAHPDLKNVLLMNQECGCRSGLNRGRCCYKKLKSGRSPKSVMFTFMHVLLKASNHIALLIPHAKLGPDQMKQAKQLCDIAFKDHPEFMELARDAAFRTLSDPKYCGKMKVLHGMLSVFAKDHSKVLVFSYSTKLLDILEQHVMSEGFDYRRIDGSVTGRRRQEIVREFNANPDIFLCLVSTKAGGLGLNMTGANKVVIFDPNWNPSHDLQAQDRAYRIGQRRDVEVYRLISAGSIEENIYLRQIYKQQLDNVAIGTENARRYFKGIQGDADNQGELFGINNMFKLHTGDSCLTMDILSRNAKVEAGIAGHDMADYIPSWREQQDTEDSATQEEGAGSCGESSDEDTLQAFKDLFDPSSDEEGNEKQAVTPKTSTKTSDPTPSTSGLPLARKTAATAAQSTELLHDTSDSEPERNPPPFLKPTTRQRKLGKRKDSWFEERSAAEALSFLEEGDQRAGNKGKAPKRKQRRGVCDWQVPQAPQAPAMPVEDSLVTPSFSSVSSVFEQYGVVHVHDNPRVVGGSRVEDHMTRCAMHEVFELSANSQAPAAVCDPMSQPSVEEAQDTCKTPASGRKRKQGTGARGRTPSKDHNSARTVDHGCWHLLVGQTPSAIRKKHWSQLKEFKKGQQDEITLAQQVLLASPEQRLSLLKELYKSGHEAGLHDTLDSILSMPEEKRDKKDGNAVQEGRTAARTPTGGRSQTRTVKKKGGQSNAGPGKTPAVRRKRKARGLLYTDQDDTQLSQARQRSTTHLDEDLADCGFDVGARVSPAKMKALQNRRRGRPVRSRGPTQQSVVSPSLFDRSGDAPVSHRTVSRKEADSVPDSDGNAAGPVETEDVDGLLSQLGKQHGDTEACHTVMDPNQNKSDALQSPSAIPGKERTKFSVLDDIFGEPEDREMTKRKPPPSRGRRQTEKCRTTNPRLFGEDLTGAASTSGLCAVTESRERTDSRKRSSMSSSEIFSELMNNSTLRDDDVDCFGEPSQWKRRHRTRNPPVHNVERLLQKSSQDYLQLFETGRLVKKRQKEKPGDVEKNMTKYTDIVDVCEGQGRKESGEVDPSGSLFS